MERFDNELYCADECEGIKTYWESTVGFGFICPVCKKDMKTIQ